ncbi:uncharacterized protein DUF3408 [Dysgonomonas alginatilytica]|uniref:Uncharacterized protein DUF3408 n=1 Tax=Dysgonomonas alginatilytica TaxID=1605892 RepID=A0A2V3PPQ3_9BACT|nr:DUF3408 domain-containing protein [Dysgonomonas alginatilytica]PXV58466.1 uncharacterized protein DUF3408 [Dysgonomonas alginatilytica]
MAKDKTDNKYNDLLKSVHKGIGLDQPVEQSSKEVKPVKTIVDAEPEDELGEAEDVNLNLNNNTVSTSSTTELSSTKTPGKRKRKTQDDYQEVFFVRVDFTHRKPLYITAATHRRLMRIVHLMDESKATISSYVENIILNHLETFREDIDIIYRTNNLNPTE